MRQGIPAVAAARTGMKPIEWAGRLFSDGLQAGTACPHRETAAKEMICRFYFISIHRLIEKTKIFPLYL